MQKYKSEIAILSALILLVVFSLLASDSARFFGKEHPGILIVAISVAGEIVCEWRTEKSFIERLKKFFGICLVVGLLLEIVEAVKSDKQVEILRQGNLELQTNVANLNDVAIQLAHQYDLSTNALAEANARLASIRPLKNRLIDCLNIIDPSVVPALKGGKTTFKLNNVPEYKFNQMAALLSERGSAAFVASASRDGNVVIMGGVGQVENLTIVLKPELAQ